jgi:hypothetical protein
MTNQEEQIHKHTPIINIQHMQRLIGVSVSSFDWLYKKSYDELHELQNSLIERYNQALKNQAI